MRCEEFLRASEEYFDGESDARAGEAMRAHLSACQACARAYDALQREQEIYQRYEQEIELPPTLWAATQARLAEERLAAERAGSISQRTQRFRERLAGAFAAPRLSLALTATLVLMAIGVTAGVMRYAQMLMEDAPRNEQAGNDVQRDGRASAPAPESATPTAPETAAVPNANTEAGGSDVSESDAGERATLPTPERNALARADDRGRPARLRSVSAQLRRPSPEELVREAARTYEAAIAILQRDANQRRARLNAETRTRFDRALAAIDRTIAETRRAVRENPGDPVAARYMQAAYVRKIEVLREITDY